MSCVPRKDRKSLKMNGWKLVGVLGRAMAYCPNHHLPTGRINIQLASTNKGIHEKSSERNQRTLADQYYEIPNEESMQISASSFTIQRFGKPTGGILSVKYIANTQSDLRPSDLLQRCLPARRRQATENEEWDGEMGINQLCETRGENGLKERAPWSL